MRDYLRIIVDNLPEGRMFARSMLIQERLLVRAVDARLDPDDFNLNPHLQIVHVADQVVTDVQGEGFPECTREEVYLVWVTRLIFR